MLHRGYLEFIECNCVPGRLYLVPRELLVDYRPIQKDIRALDASVTREVLQKLYRSAGLRIWILDERLLRTLGRARGSIVLPDEDVSRLVVERFLPQAEVWYDTTFLHWDRRSTVARKELSHIEAVPATELDKRLMKLAQAVADKSSDWWRQVGAVAARDGEVLLAAHNHHLPDEYAPYRDGDPRANFFKGVHLELSTAIHAEAAIVAEAARRGISLEGADMYVTDFPCPPCAKLVAGAGIQRLYFSEGYAVLDGERVLRDADVELFRVDV